MHISFSPQRRDDALTLEKIGDQLRINGELFNFSPLGEGDTILSGGVPCEWIVGPVERINGEIHLTLILPHGPNPSQAVAFPQPIHVTEDGEIEIPEGSDPVTPVRVRTDAEYEADQAKHIERLQAFDEDWNEEYE